MTDVVELLQDLIRFDTTNPPGNETECMAHVQRLIEEAGVKTKIVAKNRTTMLISRRLTT